MRDNIFIKVKYKLYYLLYLISEWIKKDGETRSYSRIAVNFIKFNNEHVLKYIKRSNFCDKDKVLVLLPHCLQYHDCKFRITGNIDNCAMCGKCVIAEFKRLKEKYPVEIKIATGGTLAWKHIKDIRPKVVLAVACKRDLMSGIHDAYPMKVYGIFNEIKGEPCIDTSVSMDKIAQFFNIIYEK